MRGDNEKGELQTNFFQKHSRKFLMRCEQIKSKDI